MWFSLVAFLGIVIDFLMTRDRDDWRDDAWIDDFTIDRDMEG